MCYLKVMACKPSVTYSNTIVADAFGHSIDASPDPISSGTLHMPA
jgi:hypothetical protein